MSPSNYIDLTGKRFGRLLVEGRAPNGPHWVVRWWVVCDCGTRKAVQSRLLRQGRTVSCECAKRERIARLKLSHGKSATPEYFVFNTMKDRCTNPRNNAYHNYGGRGIVVEWPSFEAFYADMGPRPSPKHTVERRDNDGPYSGANCYWATRAEQAANTRRNRRIEYHGTSFSIKQLAEHLGLSYSCLSTRILHGHALDAPLRYRKKGSL